MSRVNRHIEETKPIELVLDESEQGTAVQEPETQKPESIEDLEKRLAESEAAREEAEAGRDKAEQDALKQRELALKRTPEDFSKSPLAIAQVPDEMPLVERRTELINTWLSTERISESQLTELNRTDRQIQTMRDMRNKVNRGKKNEDTYANLQPMGQRLKLDFEARPGYVTRVVVDDNVHLNGKKIRNRQAEGWRFVTKDEGYEEQGGKTATESEGSLNDSRGMGSAIQVNCGQGVTGYLMEIPIEAYEERQNIKERANSANARQSLEEPLGSIPADNKFGNIKVHGM